MGKPTEQELNQALGEAARLRESGEDDQFVGKALLNHHYRIGLLEDVMRLAKRYLHSGHGSKEHTLLIRAIEKAERASGSAEAEDGLVS